MFVQSRVSLLPLTVYSMTCLTYFFDRNDRGDDGHNLVTIVMHQFNMDPQTAMNYISDLHDKLARQFLDQWMRIPTFGGPLDLEVITYCDGLGNWVRANDTWSFEVRLQIFLF